MHSKSLLVLIFVMFVFLAGCTVSAQPAGEPQFTASQKESSVDFTRERFLECKFFIPEEFGSHVSSSSAYKLEGELAAGVVPHHLVAGRLIASFFARAGQEEYDTVILVGPSHFPAERKAITTSCGWSTPFGILNVDKTFFNRIMNNPHLAPLTDNDGVENDHAAAALVPYIKSFLPNAELGIVLMANGTSYTFVSELAKEINSLAKTKKVLLIASIDFSHYLDPSAAALRDIDTMEAVEAFDIRAIRKMTDSNIDSPESMIVLLEYLQMQGIENIEQLDHSSSDKILDLPLNHPAMSEGTTTYFIYGAVKP